VRLESAVHLDRVEEKGGDEEVVVVDCSMCACCFCNLMLGFHTDVLR